MRTVTERRLPFQWWENKPEVQLTAAETTTLIRAYHILAEAREKAQRGDDDADTEFDTAWLGLSELLTDSGGNLITGNLKASRLSAIGRRHQGSRRPIQGSLRRRGAAGREER